MEEYKTQNENEEIDLINYLKLICKRKQLIFAVFLITVIGVGVYIFFIVPEVYKIETTLEIGIVEIRENTRQVVEPPPQVLEKIKSGFYGSYSGIKITNPDNTNLVKIEIISKNPEDAKKALENINKKILADHNEKIDSQKNLLEKQKNIFSETIESLREDVSSLILKGQQIAVLKAKIYDFRLVINNLEKQMEGFQPTKVINEPSISNISTASRFLYIVIAGALGIFLGVILAFGKEWWEKNKARI